MEDTELAEVIRKAVTGEQDAIEQFIWFFMPLINSHSVISGRISEDLRQHIIMFAIEKLPNLQQESY